MGYLTFFGKAKDCFDYAPCLVGHIDRYFRKYLVNSSVVVAVIMTDTYSESMLALLYLVRSISGNRSISSKSIPKSSIILVPFEVVIVVKAPTE